MPLYIRRLSMLLLGVALLATLRASPATAQDQQYDISNYDTRLLLQRDGRYVVEETIRFDFQQGMFTHAQRRISMQYIETIRDVHVQGEDVAVTGMEHGVEDGDYHIRWTFPERSRPATFMLHYTVEGPLYTEDGRNVIDWQAVGTAWDVPVADVDLRVQLPDWGLTRDSIRLRPAEEGTLERVGGGWQAAFAHERLGPGVGYRAIVSFPQRIEAPARSSSDVSGWQLLLALLGGLCGLGLGLVGFVHWRGASAGAPVAPASAPDLSLPQAAYLRAGSLNESRCAFTAVLFDLARRGHVTLRRAEEDQLFASRETVEVDVHPADDDPLTAFERALLERLRTHDTLQDFGKEERSFRQEQMKRVRRELVELGWVEAHPTRSNCLFAAALLLVAAATGFGLALSGSVAALGVGLGTGGALGAVLAATRRYVLTEAGATRKAVLKAHLDRLRTAVEADRQTQPARAVEHLLQYLPWLALDPEVDKNWLDDLKEALAESHADVSLPSWIEDTAGVEETDSAALAAFLPCYYVVTMTSAAAGAGAVAGSAAGAGAGAAGGAGGGGGGAG